MLGTGIRTICGQSESGQCNSRAVKPAAVGQYFSRMGGHSGCVYSKGILLISLLSRMFLTVTIFVRVRTIVQKNDSPIVDSIGQNYRPMR